MGMSNQFTEFHGPAQKSAGTLLAGSFCGSRVITPCWSTSMSRQASILLVVAAWFLVPTAIVAQTHDAEHVEILTPPANAPSPPPAPDLARVTQLIVAQTNQFRKAEGRAEVAVNDKLTVTAKEFAEYMARTLRFGHTADGNKPADRAAKAGYEYCLIAENIAYAYRSTAFTAEDLAKQFVDGWEKSPGHRKNMLDPDVTETGVAVARNPESGYFFAVQLFGRPKSLAIEFRIANRFGETVRYRVDDQTFDLPARYSRTHQTCRSPEVTFLPPEGQAEAAKLGPTIRPKNGERYAVEAAANGVKVSKE
jgi:uncharacterized protein YkwD